MIKIKMCWSPVYKTITALQTPKYIEWVRDDSAQIEAYIDLSIYDVLKSNNNKPKIAILLESGGHYQKLHDDLKCFYDKFEYIFTFDLDLLNLPNAKKIIFGGVWSDNPNCVKSKNVSFCCTTKTMIPSHIERLKLADQICDKVDMKGSYTGRNATTKEIYEDYRYSIVFECEYTSYYFTEKLCNAFANKCIPINYGCTDLASFGFDMNGVIQINDIQQIVDLVNSDFDWEAEYEKRKEAIEFNYNVVQKYKSFEDWFYLEYKDLLEDLENERIER